MFYFLTASSGRRKEQGWKGTHQPFLPHRSMAPCGTPRREGESFRQVGVCRGPQREKQSLHAPTLFTPSPDSSQLFKLVTLHLPFTGTSPQAQVPGTQASP